MKCDRCSKAWIYIIILIILILSELYNNERGAMAQNNPEVIKDLSQVKEEFNKHADQVRIVAILSPT
jgi:hypothetical protein